MEGSFAQAANEHGFKRSRWRRLWRQQIQDWLIAAVQNIKILLRDARKPTGDGMMTILGRTEALQAVRTPNTDLLVELLLCYGHPLDAN